MVRPGAKSITGMEARDPRDEETFMQLGTLGVSFPATQHHIEKTVYAKCPSREACLSEKSPMGKSPPGWRWVGGVV